MKRFWNFPFAAFVVGSALIGFSAINLYPVWVGVMVFWFGCLAAQYRLRTPDMSRALTIWHQSCVLVFPVASTILKWHLFANNIGADVGFGNRVQHFSWAFCTVGLFAPTLVRWIEGNGLVQKIVVTIGFVGLLGNLNEIAEWRKGGMQYGDTMKDLVMNVAGSFAGALVIAALGRLEQRPETHLPRHSARSRQG
jgi:hypothetical protein